MTEQHLLSLGFKAIPHLILGQTFSLDIGRGREVSVMSIGTPNEMVFLGVRDGRIVTDAVCIHNYDYDGYMTEQKLNTIVSVFSKNKPNEENSQ